uniref:Uncharacterized protein n=1 Tax=Oryza glaberrima TaxID=4538 RepID=I1PTE8_ORYGL
MDRSIDRSYQKPGSSLHGGSGPGRATEEGASPEEEEEPRERDSPEGGWACAASGFAPRGEELSGGLGGWGTERRGSGMGGEESGGGGGGRRRRGLRRRRRGENVMRSGLSLRWVNLIVSV